MGRDPNDDDSVTDINVEVESSTVAEITISGAGDVSLRASAEMASPADAEPRTLQPRMTVHGLGPSLSPPTLSPPTLPSPSPSTSRPRRDDDEEDETALNVDDRLLEVIAAEQRKARVTKAAFGPIITPSEPHLVTSPPSVDPPPSSLDAAPTAKGLGAEPIAIPAVAGPSASVRFIDSEPDLNEPTAKRPPLQSDVDDETVTDAMRMLASQQSADRVEQAVALAGIVGTMPMARADDGALPDSERPGQPGAPAGTLRMNFPKNTSSLVYGDEALRPPTPAPFPLPAAEPPAAPPGPDSFRANGGVPVPVPVPVPGPTVRTRPAKKRGSGRVLALLFLVSVVAAGGALYRSKYRPAWMTLRRFYPVAAVAPSAPPQVSVTATAPDPLAVDASTLDASALDAGAADAGTLDASASDASVLAAAPAPSASTSARGRARGRPPRR